MSDVLMPTTNGVDLAIALQAEHPETKILLFSGQPTVEQMLQKAREEGHSFKIVAKPIHPTVILNTISNLLAGPQSCP